jgi:hypothetical protein
MAGTSVGIADSAKSRQAAVEGVGSTDTFGVGALAEALAAATSLVLGTPVLPAIYERHATRPVERVLPYS